MLADFVWDPCFLIVDLSWVFLINLFSFHVMLVGNLGHCLGFLRDELLWNRCVLMMGSLSEEEEDQFFDTRDDITSVSDSGSDCPEISDCDFGVVNSLHSSFGYEVWIKNPSSIHERRNKFLKWMGISTDQTVKEDPNKSNAFYGEVEVETDKITKDGEAVLGSLSYEDGHSSSQSSMSCWSSDTRELFDGATEENLVCRIRNLDDGTEFIVDDLGQDGVLERLREVGSNRLLTVEEFERNLGLSPLVQQVMRRGVYDGYNLGAARKPIKKGWLRRLSSVACIVNKQMEAGGMMSNDSYPIARAMTQTVRVRSHRKRFKELSSLYMGQDIQAHEGSILTMKFSPDGQYLASAGEDGIVRVWQVVESERLVNYDAADFDSSRVYFTTNNLSELVPIFVEKDKKGKLRGLRKTSDSACVIFPQKVFQILERPIHEFHGHSGEVLDLSWSRNKVSTCSQIIFLCAKIYLSL